MGGRRMIYHSALQEELSNLKELDSYQNNGNTVFQYDINNGYNNIFDKADCIYIEPAWRDGYYKFAKRAGVFNAEFNDYLDNIREVIVKFNKPSFVVMGKHMIKRLAPDYTIQIKLHGYGCYVGVYNSNINGEFKTNYDFMEYISTKFNKVLDFCCGYGNTLKYFKSFIACDINKKCVYCVAKEYMRYE